AQSTPPLRLGDVRIQLHVPVEVVPPTLRRVPDPDRDRHHRVPLRLEGLTHQVHARLFRQSPALAIVTPPARRDDVLPGLIPALRDGDHVVEGEILRSELAPAVLAPEPVPGEDIDPGELHRAVGLAELDHLQQPHDRGQLEGDRDPVDLAVIDLQHLPPGSAKVVSVRDVEVALFNLEGAIFAIDNMCQHAGGPLGEGTIKGDIVICPWHGYRYHIKTGQYVKNPEMSVACYPVKV